MNRLQLTLRTLRDRYRSGGDPPGWRTIKTTLAAVLAYLLAVWLLGNDVPPLLAPLTALLVAQLTIEEITSRGGHDFLTTRTDLRTEDGEPVVSSWAKLVVRGE